MSEKPFSIEIEVRDSECDMQGVVNNAVYQNYLEHARHKFLKTRGIDFAQVTLAGVHLVAIRIEIDYHAPLKSGESAIVTVEVEKVSRLRYGFRQQITRISDGRRCVDASVIATALDRHGRPFAMPELDALLT